MGPATGCTPLSQVALLLCVLCFGVQASSPVAGGKPGRVTRKSLKGDWTSYEFAFTCHDCGVAFNLLRWRHHCRGCGLVFCNGCTSPRVMNPEMESLGAKRPQRMCKKCKQDLASNPLRRLGGPSSAGSGQATPVAATSASATPVSTAAMPAPVARKKPAARDASRRASASGSASPAGGGRRKSADAGDDDDYDDDGAGGGGGSPATNPLKTATEAAAAAPKPAPAAAAAPVEPAAAAVEPAAAPKPAAAAPAAGAGVGATADSVRPRLLVPHPHPRVGCHVSGAACRAPWLLVTPLLRVAHVWVSPRSRPRGPRPTASTWRG